MKHLKFGVLALIMAFGCLLSYPAKAHGYTPHGHEITTATHVSITACNLEKSIVHPIALFNEKKGLAAQPIFIGSNYMGKILPEVTERNHYYDSPLKHKGSKPMKPDEVNLNALRLI